MKRFLYALLFFWFAASAFAQDVKAVAVQARSRQPAVMLDHAQASAVLRDTVILLGKDWAFLRKDGGNNCDVGAAFRVSCDWVIHIPTNRGCDLFGDAPAPDVRGTMQPRDCHLEPSPGPWVPAGPAPTPPAPAPDPILQRLAALERDVEKLKQPQVVELPLDVLLKGLQSINFECVIGRSAFHGHGCTITPYVK